MKTFVKVYNFFTAPRDDEEGAGMVEYALLVGLIGVTLIAAITPLRNAISDIFGRASTALNSAG